MYQRWHTHTLSSPGTGEDGLSQGPQWQSSVGVYLLPLQTIISPSDSSPSHTLSTAVPHLSLRGKRLMNLRVFLVEWPSYSGCPHRPRLSQKSQAHPVLVRPWVEASPSSGDHTAATRDLRELQRVGAPSPEPVKGPWTAVGSSVRNDSLRPRASQDNTGSHIFLCVCLTHHLPRL